VLFAARAGKPKFVDEMLDEGGFLPVDSVVVGSQENDRLTVNFNCEGKCCLSPPAAVLLGRRGTRTVGTAHARAEQSLNYSDATNNGPPPLPIWMNSPAWELPFTAQQCAQRHAWMTASLSHWGIYDNRDNAAM
jgi:hypothetical protein